MASGFLGIRSQKTINLIEIHMAALLFGFVGTLVKLASSDLAIVALGRSVFAVAFFIVVAVLLKQRLRLKHKVDYVVLGLLGLAQATQWLTFFQSVDVSTVAVGLLSLFTFPAFIAILEPLFFEEKYTLGGIIPAVLVFFGVALVVPEISLESSTVQGVLWGLLSAVLLALIWIVQRKYLQRYSTLKISLHRSVASALVLTPVLFCGSPRVDLGDLWLVAIMGVLCTAIPSYLFVKSMQTLKARQASAIFSLQVVYGIAFAALFIHELPSLRSILGGTVIMGVTLLMTLRAGRDRGDQ
jgi:drug/metabolite transporter (DMT)-like permease